jgi:hypothetical protein
MHEFSQLESFIAKLSTCKAHERVPLEKAVLLWAGRTHARVKEMYATLDKQLTWLDTHAETGPTYERRFQEWTGLLSEYGRACDLLKSAEAVGIGVAA